jgi:hypothetical protein
VILGAIFGAIGGVIAENKKFLRTKAVYEALLINYDETEASYHPVLLATAGIIFGVIIGSGIGVFVKEICLGGGW